MNKKPKFVDPFSWWNNFWDFRFVCGAHDRSTRFSTGLEVRIPPFQKEVTGDIGGTRHGPLFLEGYPWKVTCQWKITIFNGRYIFKLVAFPLTPIYKQHQISLLGYSKPRLGQRIAGIKPEHIHNVFPLYSTEVMLRIGFVFVWLLSMDLWFKQPLNSKKHQTGEKKQLGHVKNNFISIKKNRIRVVFLI